ncbi:glycosyltransferase family 39 protein [Flagelloscypha sp. PMI_526]|nr:glycosyltransferase family 39 protein [Flagelloscypha sp. PMI_526]
MKPQPATTIDFGPDPNSYHHHHHSSDEYEQVHYPHNAESLPLHLMDSTQRRRGGQRAEPVPFQEEEDYSKEFDRRPQQQRLSSGRLRTHVAPPSTFGEFIDQNLEHIVPVLYTLAACWTRFHRIGAANLVVWDEAHFGKFGTHYLKREFYFDVHPPLGKMLVGLAGLLSGYDGSFEFKSGETYPPEVPYTAWRVLMSLFGVGMVPLAWYTSVELGMSQWACHIVALMVLCDIGWLCISRFILLDSMLLFFTLLTVFCLTKFHNQQWQSFSIDWYLWLILTGISIGLVSSVKLIGLFVTALVGLYTVEDLWDKFGDLKMSYSTQIQHWVARIGALIVLPFMVYMASFKIHFLVLNHSGPGDSQMSSLFQANLKGNDFLSNPVEVVYGSRVTFKNMGWGGGLLHSHVQTYPTGSNQQQVTCYHYKDENNEWNILPTWDDPIPYNPNDPELRYLQSGDVIRLQHVPTTRNLHSHPIPAPVSKLNHEVSCYGNATIGDNQDHWLIEVVDDTAVSRSEYGKRVRSLTTRLRIRHAASGCYLRADNTILPQWGFKQIEVSCIADAPLSDYHTYWNVESHWNDRLPAGTTTVRRSPFFRDFWHLNVAMWTSNNALIPDPDKEDILASQPFDWPFLHLGLRMCGWGDGQVKYYLLGNPIVWWGSTVSLMVAVMSLVWYILRWQRKYVDMNDKEWAHWIYVFKIAFGGWFLHYVPFLIMGRVTYLHHYLPTLYFSVLMFAHIFDHFVFSSPRFSQQTKAIVFGVLAFAIVSVFWWFSGLAFGVEGPIKDEWGLGWRRSWNIYNQL